VARLLPRHWDGRRLLRFLTGLAMLALAFTTPAVQTPAAMPATAEVPATVAMPATAEMPATPATVAVSERASAPVASVTLSEPAPAPLPVRAPAAPRSAEILAIMVAAAFAVSLTGRTPQVRGERAPPAA
jgi:hypothetical protein